MKLDQIIAIGALALVGTAAAAGPTDNKDEKPSQYKLFAATQASRITRLNSEASGATTANVANAEPLKEDTRESTVKVLGTEVVTPKTAVTENEKPSEADLSLKDLPDAPETPAEAIEAEKDEILPAVPEVESSLEPSAATSASTSADSSVSSDSSKTESSMVANMKKLMKSIRKRGREILHIKKKGKSHGLRRMHMHNTFSREGCESRGGYLGKRG